MTLYRVLLHDPSAAPTEPGGALYVPAQQGSGRIDNPAHYRVLYLGDSAAGACAEVFYRGAHRTAWTPTMLPLRRYPHLVRALASYELVETAPVCDLDDPERLLEFQLRPSQVITREYARSQAWALRLFHEQRFCGVSWWSFHDARWKSVGLWNTESLAPSAVTPLTIDHPAFAQAAAVLDVRIVSR
ncbi:MAG TPA: RES family NAD+ phosphorylase [Candidatus Dormibacteraeota bacterium]|nr:RES family NAD+ phosphorylase [Candidatus Dormibacteraeota bacterium]